MVRMWRQNDFRRFQFQQESRDSDQSISDEDEFDNVTYDNGCWEKLRSPYEKRGNTDKIQVASQLEALEGKKHLPSTGAHELNFEGWRTSTSLEELEFFPSEAAEMHEFQKEENGFIQSHPRNISTTSSDDVISEEENENNAVSKFSVSSGMSNFRGSPVLITDNENHGGACTWSTVLKEADELAYLHENAANFSSHAANHESENIRKVSGSKAKLKFSIHFQSSHKEGLSWPSVLKDEKLKPSKITQVPRVLEALENRIKGHSMSELLEGLQEGSEEISKSPKVPVGSVALVHSDMEHSTSELLEGVQEKKGRSKESSKMNSYVKERSSQLSGKTMLSPLGNRALDNEDLLAMDCGVSSEDDESNQNRLIDATSKIEGQTMVDRLHEVCNAAAVDDEGSLFPICKQTTIGFYARLQRAMQNEKERHMVFLKQLQTVGPQNESGCFDVQIMSRYLEAKLTVCHCSFYENETSQCMKNPKDIVDGEEKRIRTIIFSSRICTSVDLEVGNWVRVHPPWKEVQVTEDESFILCTYFSQILR